MLITPDFTADTSGPIPAGNYPARVIGVEAKTSRKGEAYLNWAFELFGADKYTGRRAYVMTTDGKPAAWGLKSLRMLYKAATGEDLQEKPFDTDSIIGAEVTVSLAPSVRPDGTTSDFPDVKAITALKH